MRLKYISTHIFTITMLDMHKSAPQRKKIVKVIENSLLTFHISVNPIIYSVKFMYLKYRADVGHLIGNTCINGEEL